MLNFMSQNKPEIIKPVMPQGHSDHRLIIEPSANAVNFAIGKLLHNYKTNTAFSENFRHEPSIFGINHEGAKFGQYRFQTFH